MTHEEELVAAVELVRDHPGVDHIWLNALKCVRPTDEFAAEVGREIIAKVMAHNTGDRGEDPTTRNAVGFYLGETGGHCTVRGRHARKKVQLAATSSDLRTTEDLEKWTQSYFLDRKVKVGTETWFEASVDEVERVWAQAPEMWYVQVERS